MIAGIRFTKIRWIGAVAIVLSVFLTGPLLSQDGGLAQFDSQAECASLENASVGYDYRATDDRTLGVLADVESNHLKEQVRSLTRGQTTKNPMADLNFVLQRVPNHHHALMLVTRYELGDGNRSGFPPARCYFNRALRFRPQDATVHMLYGTHLFSNGDLEAAVESYNAALSIDPQYLEAHYNLGLLYVKLEHFPDARRHAAKAYELGSPWEGLKNQLMRHGEWIEISQSSEGANR
jgi:tetratricopeptide (TPR) repeat protein